MKRKLFWLPVALACLIGCGSSVNVAKEETAEQKQDVTAEFRPLVEKVVAAWATLEPSRPAEYYAKDSDLAFFDAAPLKYRGWQEYEAGWEATVKDWKSMKIAPGSDFQATRMGNVTWVTCTMHVEIEPKTGAVLKMDARLTQIWEKRGDNWLIVHEHLSVPIAEPAAPAAS